MTTAIEADKPGGPEVLRLVDVTLAPPGPGEAQLRHLAIGVNFIDVYERRGDYPVAFPMIPDMRARAKSSRSAKA